MSHAKSPIKGNRKRLQQILHSLFLDNHRVPFSNWFQQQGTSKGWVIYCKQTSNSIKQPISWTLQWVCFRLLDPELHYWTCEVFSHSEQSIHLSIHPLIRKFPNGELVKRNLISALKSHSICFTPTFVKSRSIDVSREKLFLKI